MDELLLWNPRKKGKGRKKKTASRRRKKRYRRNPANPAVHAGRKYRVHYRVRARRNPIRLRGLGSDIPFQRIIGITGGAILNKTVTDQVMSLVGLDRVGLVGYIGEGVMGIVLGQVTRMVSRSPKLGTDITTGAFVGLASRVVGELLAGGGLFGITSPSAGYMADLPRPKVIERSTYPIQTAGRFSGRFSRFGR